MFLDYYSLAELKEFNQKVTFNSDCSRIYEKFTVTPPHFLVKFGFSKKTSPIAIIFYVNLVWLIDESSYIAAFDRNGIFIVFLFTILQTYWIELQISSVVIWHQNVKCCSFISFWTTEISHDRFIHRDIYLSVSHILMESVQRENIRNVLRVHSLAEWTK